MSNSRLKQQLEFCLEADKEKKIGRQTYISDASRKENDAEHAWHMALMTLILSEYANDEIDVLKTISMILIHDIVAEDEQTLDLIQAELQEKGFLAKLQDYEPVDFWGVS